jgi:hypothetical protein
MVPNILNFTAITAEQVRRSSIVFTFCKEGDVKSVETIPGTDLAQEEALPTGNVTGAILQLGDPKIGIVLALLNDRHSVFHHEDFRLFVVIGHHVGSFQLIPRFTSFGRVHAPDDEEDLVYGEWRPETETLPFEPPARIYAWQNGGPALWDTVYHEDNWARVTPFLELPGGWWAKAEFSETLER